MVGTLPHSLTRLGEVGIMRPRWAGAPIEIPILKFSGPLLMTLKTLTAFAGAAALSFALNANATVIAEYQAEGNANDSTGAHNGTVAGAVSYAPGHSGQAFSMNGGYVEVPDDPALDLVSAYTITAWISLDSAGATARIVDKITVGGIDGYLLDVLDGKLRLISGGTQVVGATDLPAGQFVQVAAAFDGSALTVYVNGSLDGQAAGAGPTQTNNLPLRIGADSLGDNLFPGLIDDVQISDSFDLPEPGTLTLFALMPVACRAARWKSKARG